VYPHRVLDWHEIVNDQIELVSFGLTYCPLTGSGIAFDRHLSSGLTTFGVSGLLYNSNLIPYDRGTESNWSQMKMLCVQGVHSGDKVKTFPVVELPWKLIPDAFPDAQVVSLNTGYSRPYGSYPYGDYQITDNLLFPVSPRDTRLFAKERVLGVIVNDRTIVFRFKSFKDRVSRINTRFNGLDLVIFGSQPDNFLTAFERRLTSGELVNLTAMDDVFPIIAEDDHGGKWNIFGEAVSGPHEGVRLSAVDSYMAYWFAWGAFWPGADIFEG